MQAIEWQEKWIEKKLEGKTVVRQRIVNRVSVWERQPEAGERKWVGWAERRCWRANWKEKSTKRNAERNHCRESRNRGSIRGACLCLSVWLARDENRLVREKNVSRTRLGLDGTPRDIDFTLDASRPSVFSLRLSSFLSLSLSLSLCFRLLFRFLFFFFRFTSGESSATLFRCDLPCRLPIFGATTEGEGGGTFTSIFTLVYFVER